MKYHNLLILLMSMVLTLMLKRVDTIIPPPAEAQPVTTSPSDVVVQVSTQSSPGAQPLTITIPPDPEAQLLTVPTLAEPQPFTTLAPPLPQLVTIKPHAESQLVTTQPPPGAQTATIPPDIETKTVILTMAPDVSQMVTSRHPTTPELRYHSVFDDLRPQNASLVDQILDIEDRICDGLCRGYPNNRKLPRWNKCGPCRCDTLCTVYRDCCPDVLLRYGGAYQGKDMSTCRQGFSVPRPVDVNNPYPSDDYQSALSRCPHATIETETNVGDGPPLIARAVDAVKDPDIFKCEHPDTTDIDQSLPVSSATSGLTYRNRFCAACHNDTDNLLKWGASMYCENSKPQILAQVKTKDELLRKMLSPEVVETTGCRLRYVTPYAADYSRPCSPRVPAIISACNVSGIARYVDPRVEQACGMYTSIFEQKYRNIFCYICNEEYPPPFEVLRMYVQWGIPANSLRVSFSALVDFDEDDSSGSFAGGDAAEVQSPADCLPNEYYDALTCNCTTSSCGEGKYLTPNGSCESLVRSNLLGYKVCYELLIEAESEISAHDIDMFRFRLIPPSGTITSLGDYVKNWCPGSNTTLLAYVILFAKPGTLEELEDDIGKALNDTMTEAIYNLPSNIARIRLALTNTCFNESLANRICDTNSSVRINPYNRPVLVPFEYNEARTHFIHFLDTNRCPFVELPKDNFSATDQEQTFIYQPTRKLISRSSVDEISETEVRVCVSDYIVLTDTDLQVCRRKVDDFDTWTVSGLISIICTCISLFCLLLTFITYVIFPPLRGGGGKNIMTLIVTLFTAQAFYEFAIEQFENPAACKAFGITVHYTWLAAVFSMNACTIERFYKLCFPLKSRALFMTSKPFILATVYTFAFPTVIVVINVIVNLVTRDNIGYGSPRLCYINTSTSRILAFGVPMGVVVLFNIFLLIITIYNLRRKTDLDTKSSSHTKIGLLACARLSIITGLTWLLAFLYEAAPSEIFSYIFTALIGLQGVMFFVSMVLNKRVIGLYSELIIRQRDKQVSVSTSNSSKKSQDKSSQQRNYTIHATKSSSGGVSSVVHEN